MRRLVSIAGILGLLLIVMGVAGTAHEATAANPHIRFVDNGNGTITDNQTGLVWEKKLAEDGSIHSVNNGYQWSSSGSAADGALFTDFLARINAALSTSSDGTTVADVCFAGHCDWRVPNIAELQTILNCSFSPCIDPIFGPTAADFYWSSTSFASGPSFAWFVSFSGGFVVANGKDLSLRVRAVRGGP